MCITKIFVYWKTLFLCLFIYFHAICRSKVLFLPSCISHFRTLDFATHMRILHMFFRWKRRKTKKLNWIELFCVDLFSLFSAIDNWSSFCSLLSFLAHYILLTSYKFVDDCLAFFIFLFYFQWLTIGQWRNEDKLFIVTKRDCIQTKQASSCWARVWQLYFVIHCRIWI